MRWFNVHIKRSQVRIQKLRWSSIPEDCFFISANIVDPNKMLHSAVFHQGLHCLSKYLFRDIQYKKVNVPIMTELE